MKRALTLRVPFRAPLGVLFRSPLRAGMLLWLLQVGTLSACGDDPPPPPVEPEPERTVEPPVVAAAPEAPEPTADEIPIPEDFEEEAAKDISANDLRSQLDALEQEISSAQ